MITQKMKRLLEQFEGAKSERDQKIFALLNEIAQMQKEHPHKACDLFCNVLCLLREEKPPRTAPFRRGSDLLAAFYNTMRREGTEEYQAALLLRTKLPPNEKRERLDTTMLDYTARIVTFSNHYIYEIFDRVDGYDPLVFLYENLEYAAAKFSVKEKDGTLSKQRMNTRSALRKFNEFKILTEKQLRR